MARMKALKTFRVGDTNLVVQPGMEFETKNSRHYEQHGLAVPVGAVAKTVEPKKVPQANPAAQTGPLASPGGKTGEAKPLLSSRLGRRQKTRTSRTLGDEPASSQ